MTDHFTHNFPFLKERIEQDPEYALTKEDLELIAQEISMNESIQRFEIPRWRRVNNVSEKTARSFYFPIFDALKINTSITTLALREWYLMDFSSLIAQMIMMNNTITHLNLSGDRFGSEIMYAIRMNSTIQSLNISSCDCDDQIFENTRGSNLNLTSLDISGNYFNFKHVAEWLKYNVNLTSLTLSGSQITGNGKEVFCEWFSKQFALTDFQVMNIQGNISGIGACLKIHRKLKRFAFHYTLSPSVTEEGFSVLESLSFNTDLRSLDLSGSFRHQEYPLSISRLIGNLPSLTELNLEDNRLDDKICEPLKQNSILTTLNLYNCLNRTNVVKLCKVLHNHPALTWLNLGASKERTKNEVLAISKLLQTQIPLQSLYFEARSNKCVAIEPLAEALKTNHTLTFLSLAEIRCEDVGAIELAECLTVNTTLTELNLRRNCIEDDGVIAIAQSLEKNTSLKILNLRNNYVSNRALDSVLKMLDINTTLTELKMIGCVRIDREQIIILRKKYGRRLVI